MKLQNYENLSILYIEASEWSFVTSYDTQAGCHQNGSKKSGEHGYMEITMILFQPNMPL